MSVCIDYRLSLDHQKRIAHSKHLTSITYKG
ncbi:hypothetical protein VP468E531_P0065 [Vibrio phage 468E53-1]|nr:hypothetical protein VP468E531_P0065 [Vibrio phage 468E53-1]CAH9016160.1 hypothetical protein VP177E371_P0064 [Vibrio phage 177E37-1]